MDGVKSKAKEVAISEVARRVKTLAEAKEDYKAWIHSGLNEFKHSQETIDFWLEVSKQVDLIESLPTQKA